MADGTKYSNYSIFNNMFYSTLNWSTVEKKSYGKFLRNENRFNTRTRSNIIRNNYVGYLRLIRKFVYDRNSYSIIVLLLYFDDNKFDHALKFYKTSILKLEVRKLYI